MTASFKLSHNIYYVKSGNNNNRPRINTYQPQNRPNAIEFTLFPDSKVRTDSQNDDKKPASAWAVFGLSAAEICRLCAVTPRTVARWAVAGHAPAGYAELIQAQAERRIIPPEYAGQIVWRPDGKLGTATGYSLTVEQIEQAGWYADALALLQRDYQALRAENERLRGLLPAATILPFKNDQGGTRAPTDSRPSDRRSTCRVQQQARKR